MTKNALKHYNQVGAHASVQDANAHRLIQLLMQRVLEKINTAKAHMSQQKLGPKGECISTAIAILGGLQSSLDLEKGGALAQNLSNLYEYMKLKLFEANVLNNADLLDEVSKLMLTIKSGWDGIEDEAKRILES